MFKLISSSLSIGLERTSDGIKSASIAGSPKKPILKQLTTHSAEIENVKRIYTNHPIFTTGLTGKEVLVRSLHLPLTKDKDIESALVFQAEPLLPYAVDQALIAYQIVSKTEENSHLTLLTAHKEVLSTHLKSWQSLQMEPEKIACIPSALSQFGAVYLSEVKSCLILHLQAQEMTGILLKEGKLIASFALTEGLEGLLTAKDDVKGVPQSEAEWLALEEQKTPLAEAFKRLQKGVIKIGYALVKEGKGELIEGIIVTGESANWEGFSEVLVRPLSLPLLSCKPEGEISSKEFLSYAVPIGLGLGSLENQEQEVDFRQQEWSYPFPWKRLKGPIATYFILILLLSYAFYFFSQQYLHYREDQLKQNYLDLLVGMHKTHPQLEFAFLAKNPRAHDLFDGEIPKVEQLDRGMLMDRLFFLQKELQATPDSFPLFANIPRVGDVLAWLNQYSASAAIEGEEGEGKPQARLQIENFSYTMLKRPQQGKKQEKYQVKIELEFSSPTPKWAREFHDALIAPNDWVDPKGEVKWSSNRGKYKTSFFLKDKTVYPGS